MYALENVGWKITRINNSFYAGAHDYNITHRVFAPFGQILQRKTIKEVVEYIETTFLSPCKFLGHTIENVPRREYAFINSHEADEFAELFDGFAVVQKIDGNYNVLI